MAVTYAQRRPKEKGADEDDKTRTLTEQYIIKVSDITDDQPTILNSSFADLPKVGDAHPTDSSVTVKNRSLEPTDSRLRWLMNVTYSDAVDALSTSGGGGGGGPVVLKVTVGKWDESFIMEVDVSNKNKRIQNSATDKIKYESTRPQIQITFSAQTKDPDFVRYQGLQGTVNKNTVRWLGFVFLGDQVLFDEYRATSVGNNTWQEDFIFKMRQVPDVSGGGGGNTPRIWGWQPRLLDAGFNELIDVNGQKQLTAIKAPQAAGDKKPPRAVTQEWPLDGNGIALAADEIDGSKVFLSFQTFVKSDFGQFNFDFESILSRNAQERIGL